MVNKRFVEQSEISLLYMCVILVSSSPQIIPFKVNLTFYYKPQSQQIDKNFHSAK